MVFYQSYSQNEQHNVCVILMYMCTAVNAAHGKNGLKSKFEPNV